MSQGQETHTKTATEVVHPCNDEENGFPSLKTNTNSFKGKAEKKMWVGGRINRCVGKHKGRSI